MAFGLFKKKTYADSVYRGGIVRTLDAETEGATAVACKDGKVVFAGSDEGVSEWIGKDTVVTELNGRFLVPGFIELSGTPAKDALKGSYLSLHPGMSSEEVAQSAERWAAEHAPCDFILAFGWSCAEESLPAIDAACPGIPLLIIGEDSISMRLNRAAQDAVNQALSMEVFEVAVTPAYVFNTIAAMDFSDMSRKAFETAQEYAKRGFTSVLNLEACTYFDDLYRNLLLELFQSGMLKQRYFGTLPVKRMIAPMSVLYLLDRRRTACVELQGLINFDTLCLTASADKDNPFHMRSDYLKSVCDAAADKGYSIRLNALDKETALCGTDILGSLSASYKKTVFTVAYDGTLSEQDKADVFTGEVYECPLTDPLPLTGTGERMLARRTEEAAWRIGRPELGTITEGKAADFAVFSVDPCSVSTAQDFEALRADLTVLAGKTVYDASCGETAKDWFDAFSAEMEQTFGEAEAEGGEEDFAEV